MEALLAADVFLAAEGGEARFEQADLLDDVARLWLVATPRTLPASMLASASAADLGYAVDVVLACEGSTPANIRRVLDACIAAGRRSSPEGRFAQEQIQYLEEALAELEAPVAAV